jgi:hypothetical protein
MLSNPQFLWKTGGVDTSRLHFLISTLQYLPIALGSIEICVHLFLFLLVKMLLFPCFQWWQEKLYVQ